MRGEELYLVFTCLAIVLIVFKGKMLPWARTIILIAAVITLGFMRLDLPSVHCIVEGFFSRESVEFIKGSMYVKLAIAFLTAPLIGRVFCGYICPKGAIQELIFIRRIRNKIKVPRWLDSILRLVPYLSLAALIIFPVWYDYRFWTDFDPFLWVFYGHGHLPGLILLLIILPLSIILCRPFCRYLCPLVPIFRVLSRITPLNRSRDVEKCRACKTGLKSCDFDVIKLTISQQKNSEEKKEKPVCTFGSNECLQCGRCSKRCPREAIK